MRVEDPEGDGLLLWLQAYRIKEPYQVKKEPLRELTLQGFFLRKEKEEHFLLRLQDMYAVQ